jgi:molybdenum transport protein
MQPSALSDDVLLRLLAEDVPYGDLTTDQLGIGDRPAALTFTARAGMTVCGTEEAARLFQLAGAQAQVVVPSGQFGDGLLLTAAGDAASLHRAWKTAQVLVELYSGIASGTAAIVQKLREAGFATPLACTRKHFPGTKALAVKAVRSGGGAMHRLGLSETLLLFHEHRLFLDEPAGATVARLRASQPERGLVVEVADEREALTWAEAGAPVLQLERFEPDRVRALGETLAARGLTPILAIAGGVHAGNAVAYAAAGAGLLVSSAPYHAPPKDVKVAFALST